MGRNDAGSLMDPPFTTRGLLLGIILALFLGPGVIAEILQAPAVIPAPIVAIHQTNPSRAERVMNRQAEAWREALAQSLVRVARADIKVARRTTCSLYRVVRESEADPLRIAGFIVAESRGNPQAVSSADARGLMQILPGTGKLIAYHRGEQWRGPASLHEIETSVSYGVWYYEHLLHRFKNNEIAAVAAYNWGPEHIRKRLEKGHQLPIVYPGLVLAAEEEIRHAFWEEYRKRLEWSLDPTITYPGYPGDTCERTPS